VIVLKITIEKHPEEIIEVDPEIIEIMKARLAAKRESPTQASLDQDYIER
jgi:hypothetical protein